MLGNDEGYIVVVRDLPGRSAFGETPEAAVHEIGDATLAWIAACCASGDPMPEPTTKAPRSGLNLTLTLFLPLPGTATSSTIPSYALCP
jgi:predicted RNase H-like HicB family nuclease